MLVWDRPTNVPNEVNITYTVEINSTDGSMSFQNITSETTFSVHFLEEILPAVGSQCVEFEFFVFATNDAGTGPTVRILDTVPICKLRAYRLAGKFGRDINAEEILAGFNLVVYRLQGRSAQLPNLS